MKRFLTLLITATAGLGLAYAETTATFDFTQPETLDPAVKAPGLKEAIDLDGKSFTDKGVCVSFAACDYGNTHVRLYGSYDAGTNLRIYDGDMMTVSTIDPGAYITSIHVTIPLSGTNADAWFLPSSGEWIWEEDTWQPSDDKTSLVELTSYQQSRVGILTVTIDGSTGISSVAVDTPASAAEAYDLLGRPVDPATHRGIYIDPATRTLRIR